MQAGVPSFKLDPSIDCTLGPGYSATVMSARLFAPYGSVPKRQFHPYLYDLTGHSAYRTYVESSYTMLLALTSGWWAGIRF